MSRACYVCGVTEWTTRVGSLRDAPSVGVVECSNCGLVVPAEVPPVVIDYAAGTMHGNAPIDWVGQREIGAEDNQRRAAEVRTLLDAGDSVLDVGCGSGGFIHELKRGGSERVWY
jgi:rubredoxin